ncbi:MAG: hypothetical protein ABFD46_09955 [Armatimonadota bacterium]
MDKAHSIYRMGLKPEDTVQLVQRSASSLKVKEKQIENWMATKPELLFSNPESLQIIAQEVSGELMADILAVDSQGNLIIIEIKRESSDRGTVGQLLDYAARLASWNYDDFNRRWQNHTKTKNDLFEEFKTFVENPDFDKDDFLKDRRLFILASSEDESMKRIISWLRDTYAVPIDFVPFQFYEDNEQVYLDIAKIDIEPLTIRTKWSGDWFFNTNETYSKGAYSVMLEQDVIAVYGYEGDRGKEMISQPAVGERVFAYLNSYGIIAVGTIVDDEVFSANSVFGKQHEKEFHRKVKWETKVKPAQAVSSAQVSQWNYNLPVRSTLCRMNAGAVADRIATALNNNTSR